MSNVTLSIGGRDYKVACADGEEGHVLHLGKMIDEKLQGMDSASTQSETRLLLFASLLLADEIHELRRNTSPASSVRTAPVQDSGSAKMLEQFAQKLENLATKLEQEGAQP